MSCVIDGRHLNGKIAGVQRLIHEVIPELDRIAKSGEYEILVPPKADNLPTFHNIPIKKYGCFNGLLWEQICLPWYLFTRKKYGVFLCTVVPYLYPRGLLNVNDVMVKTVPVVRDSIKNPVARFLLLLNYRIGIKHAALLTTISQYSKNDIVRAYGKKPEDIHIIPLGWEHILRIKSDTSWKDRHPELITGEFYFSLSANRKQKNFKWIYEMAKRNPKRVFAIAGSQDEWQKQKEYQAPNLKYLGYLPDGEIRSLMENCKAFLFPSFAEGFGIPPMEALAVGAKVVVANASCLPEIYSDSVYYIDPFGYEVDLDSLLKEEIAPASNVLDRYGWDKTAKKIDYLVHQYLNK